MYVRRGRDFAGCADFDCSVFCTPTEVATLKHLAIVLCLFAPSAFAAEEYLGSIVATTGAAINQTDTAVPFVIGPASNIAVQCNVAAYVRMVSAVTGAATAATSVKVGAEELYVTKTGNTLQYLSVLGVSATATCKVFRVYL